MQTVKLTTEDFIEKIFDYRQESEWRYKGGLPAIIDFYADWCGPCKAVAPLLEELAAEYDGKIVIYKLDTEAEQEVASAFGISSIPTFLFIPMEGLPVVNVGALPKKDFREVIEWHLLNVGAPGDAGDGSSENDSSDKLDEAP